ncbi:hypothetical protein [Nonomuraea sp. NPDC050643]|uniref:hypothetical protein n=1 Tax=Nonomuraea sp. NPDC050643 TaxID=3155660 RepID=UPI0033EA02AF
MTWTRLVWWAQPGEVDESERRHLLAELAARAADLVTRLQGERARLQVNGQDTAWVDQVLGEMEVLAVATLDLTVAGAIRAVIERHGGGPYPAEDLAALAGVPLKDAQRVLDQVVRAGLATPPAQRPPEASPS